MDDLISKSYIVEIIYSCFNGNKRKVCNQDGLMNIYHECVL